MPGVFSSKRNLLFDLDGTLVDSAPAHARAFVASLAPQHSQLAESFDYAPFAGRPTREVFLAHGFTKGAELDALVESKQVLYRAALERGEIGLFEGAAELLAGLRENQRRVFLVTGASGASAQRILELAKLDRFFSGIITAEHVARGKPWPDPYLFALTHHQLSASDSIAIEDGENGLRSAQNAGLEVVTVHGDKSWPDVAHARSLRELSDFLLA